MKANDENEKMGKKGQVVIRLRIVRMKTKYWGDTGKGSQNTARRRQFLPKETECWVMKLYCLKSTEEERKCGREHLEILIEDPAQ